MIIPKLLSLFAALSAANPLATLFAPLTRRNDEPEVTDEEFDNFKYWVQYAAAAYCNYEKKPGEPIECGDNQCNDVETNGGTIVQAMAGSLTDIAAFVAEDPEKEAIVVSIRGTASFANTLTDLAFLPVDCDAEYPSGCEVHYGFNAAWSEIESRVLTAVSAALDAHPRHSLIVTGHSLGGGVANLAAVSLRAAHGTADLYTYGSPRVGNDVFVEHVGSLPGGNYRLTHDADPVPLLPPSILGYRHTSPEYWLVGDSTRAEFGVRNVTVCTGFLNFECNGGTMWTKISPFAHSYYFQRLGGCGLTLGFTAANQSESDLMSGLSVEAIADVVRADWKSAGKDVEGWV